MGIQIKRVNPFELREAIVDFFWRVRAWPYPTLDEYYCYWDWRYRAISESDPIVWIALDNGAVVGHMACNIRHVQADGQPIRAGVPGNFLVDPVYRNTMVGALLAGAPLRLVNRSEIDIVLGYGNKIAHAMFLGLGCREVGRMQSYVDIRNWSPVLGRRLAAASILAPLASLSSAAWRAVRLRTRASPASRLSARALSEEEILTIDRTRWTGPPGLAWQGTPKYLIDRFLKCPIRTYRIVGILDERTAAIEGFVVSEGKARLNILQCEVNHAVLSEAEAVELAVRATAAVEVALVPLLPQSTLAADFTGVGYLQLSEARTDPVLRNTTWSAYWRPSHPLAARFAEFPLWKLWYAWSHH